MRAASAVLALIHQAATPDGSQCGQGADQWGTAVLRLIGEKEEMRERAVLAETQRDTLYGTLEWIATTVFDSAKPALTERENNQGISICAIQNDAREALEKCRALASPLPAAPEGV